MSVKFQNSGKFALAGVALILSLLLVSMVISGCVNQSASAQGQNQVPLSNMQAQNSNSQVTAQTKPNDSVVAENKTGYQKTQDTIATLVPDGSYSDLVTYAYHSGTETVNISITVKGDVITEASVMAGPNAVPYSARVIKNFNAALPTVAVGKKINELNFPKNVAGSSLTSAAFAKYANSLVEKNSNPA